MDLSQFLPDSTMGYINTAGIVIAAGSIFAATISKYTKNKTDDKIAGWLEKAHNFFGFFGMQSSLQTKRAGTSSDSSTRSVRSDEADNVKSMQKVRDHRTAGK